MKPNRDGRGRAAPSAGLPPSGRDGPARTRAAAGSVALGGEAAPPLPPAACAVVGAGVDIVEVERVAAALGRHGERFLERIFLPGEQVPGRGGRTWLQRLAGRFAAKEAVLKALGTGLRRCGWRDVEVVRSPSGRPTVRLHGALAERADELGVAEVLVSISHGRRYAVAVAMALGGATTRLPPAKAPTGSASPPA